MRGVQVRGVYMVNGTPILDIKPYLSSVLESELKRGWLAAAEDRPDASLPDKNPGQS